MAHKPFSLYKRPTRKHNHYIYYAIFYDDSGKRRTAISTGQTTKAAAKNWAHEQLHFGIKVSFYSHEFC